MEPIMTFTAASYACVNFFSIENRRRALVRAGGRAGEEVASAGD